MSNKLIQPNSKRSIKTLLSSLGLFLSPLAYAEYGLNFPELVTPIARDIYDVHMLTMSVTTVILIIVTAIILYAVFTFRKDKGYVTDQEFHHSWFDHWSWVISSIFSFTYRFNYSRKSPTCFGISLGSPEIGMYRVKDGVAFTKLQILFYSLMLLVVSLFPFVIQMSGIVYFVGALALGIGFIIHAVRLFISPGEQLAMKTFSSSILYLELLFAFLLLDHYVRVFARTFIL